MRDGAVVARDYEVFLKPEGLAQPLNRAGRISVS
jgi:hypothetical protein